MFKKINNYAVTIEVYEMVPYDARCCMIYMFLYKYVGGGYARHFSDSFCWDSISMQGESGIRSVKNYLVLKFQHNKTLLQFALKIASGKALFLSSNAQHKMCYEQIRSLFSELKLDPNQIIEVLPNVF